MAINPQSEFPGRITAANADYPYGSARNISIAGANDGTPFVARLLNDFWGFFQKLLTVAGNAPSGNPDTVVASDYYNALIEIIQTQVPQATETVLGGAEVATVAEAEALSDDTKMLTPAKLAAAFSGGNDNLTGNGYSKLPNGLILQWGITIALTEGEFVVITLPTAFTSVCLNVQVSCKRQTTQDGTDLVNAYVDSISLTQIRVIMDNVAAGMTATPVYWFAIGI